MGPHMAVRRSLEDPKILPKQPTRERAFQACRWIAQSRISLRHTLLPLREGAGYGSVGPGHSARRQPRAYQAARTDAASVSEVANVVSMVKSYRPKVWIKSVCTCERPSPVRRSPRLRSRRSISSRSHCPPLVIGRGDTGAVPYDPTIYLGSAAHYRY